MLVLVCYAVLCWWCGYGVRVYVYCVLLILGFLWIWREHAYNVNQADCTHNFRRASNSLVYFELPTYQQINRANPISLYLFLIVFVAPSIKVQCYWCGIYIYTYFFGTWIGCGVQPLFCRTSNSSKDHSWIFASVVFCWFSVTVVVVGKNHFFLFNTLYFANDFFCSSYILYIWVYGWEICDITLRQWIPTNTLFGDSIFFLNFCESKKSV